MDHRRDPTVQRKKREEWELRMIVEWLAQTFPDASFTTHIRLGKVEPRLPNGSYTEEEIRALGVWRRYADAIVYLPDRLLLIEAVLRADPGKLAQLELYEKLIPHTPELTEFSHLPVQKILLYAIEDPALLLLAREKDIQPILFVPTFFDEWLQMLRPRDRRASQVGL